MKKIAHGTHRTQQQTARAQNCRTSSIRSKALEKTLQQRSNLPKSP